MDVPAPPPELVAASRRHLTDRYASGVDRLLWQTEKRFIPDAAAVSLVTDAATAGLTDALDLGAVLVLVQAGRLDLDGLEYEIFQGTHAAGMRRDALAAILGLPDAAAAGMRQRRLEVRQAQAQPQVRERSAPDRGLPGRSGAAAQAAARARQARQLADEAAERVTLSLIHAAAALDRYAARCADLSAGAEAGAAQLLRHQATEHHRAAVSYRELAAHYGKLAGGPS